MKSRDVSVRDAQDKIEKLKRMMTETEMLEAQAELQEMATGMVTSIGGSGDTLNRVEEYLTERRDKAAGRARVASSTHRHRARSSCWRRSSRPSPTPRSPSSRRRTGWRRRRRRRRRGAAPPPPAAKEMGPEKQG